MLLSCSFLALPYWRLDVKRPCRLPSSKPQPQSATTWCVQHSGVEHCRADDLMLNVTISCLPPSHNHKVLPPGVYNIPGWSIAPLLTTWCQTSPSLVFLQATTTKCCHLVCTTLQGEALPYWRLDAKSPSLAFLQAVWTPKFKDYVALFKSYYYCKM